MTNLVSIDLATGEAYAYRDRQKVSGGVIDGWVGEATQLDRGRIELFRARPDIFRFNPSIDAVDEGRAAFLRGALRTGNPFPACSPDHSRWDQGWALESNLVSVHK